MPSFEVIERCRECGGDGVVETQFSATGFRTRPCEFCGGGCDAGYVAVLEEYESASEARDDYPKAISIRAIVQLLERVGRN